MGTNNCFTSRLLRLLTGKKASSNKKPAFMKSMNMDVWVVGASNQLFIRGSYTETKFSKKNKVVTGKTPLFVAHFALPILFCLKKFYMGILHFQY